MDNLRGWSKREKKMFKVMGYDLVEDKVWSYYASYRFDDVELMQSTGLKDKNGVEIYEGDIVRGYSVYPATDAFESFLMGEVYYTSRGTWDCYSYILGGFNEEVEVIGNIYENSELLEANDGRKSDKLIH